MSNTSRLIILLLTIALPFSVHAAYRQTAVPAITDQTSAISNFQVSSWLPTSWDIENALQSWSSNQHIITETNPIWYKICTNDENKITLNHGAESSRWLQHFHDSDTSIIPMISNSSNYECISRILRSNEERSQHISDLLVKVDQFDYDGLDIDYEKIKPEDRDLFTSFIAELSEKLHDRNKILSIAVHPQKTGRENWKGPGGQDWPALAPLVNEFKIMAYDNHWLSGEPGPIAPAGWVREILEYATQTIPRNKIYLGVPFYGYDWPIDSEGNRIPGAYSRTHRKITEDLCVKYPCESFWSEDDTSQITRYFSQYDQENHIIYHETAQSLSARIDLAREFGIAGISIWRLGSEDPQNWDVISQKTQGNSSAGFSDCQYILDQNQDSELIAQCLAANQMKALGLLNGDSQNNFHPQLPLSRAQLLKISLLTHQIDPYSSPLGAATNFIDISPTDWFTPYITKAHYAGWVNGYPDQTFRPHQPVTHSEALKIFFTASNIPVKIDNSDWSFPYWEKAQEMDIINPDWTDNKNKQFTRGQAALIMSRFLRIAS